MIENYKLYLQLVDSKLKKFFDAQSPYIKCKQGCSFCCEKGQYPYSELEFVYLMGEFYTLPEDTQLKIKEKIEEIKKEKIEFEKNNPPETKFYYRCPFLINNLCSVYEYRGVICRTHGLPYFNEDGQILIPGCYSRGLNYSEIYDEEEKKFIVENVEKIGHGVEPLAYNLSLKFLLCPEIEENLGIKFGESKALIKWFE